MIFSKKNICLFIVCSTFVFSCKRDAGYTESAMIKFLNTSVNAPKLDVFVDGTLLATQVAYPSISNTFFVPLGGTPTFRIAAYDGPQSGLIFGTVSTSLQANTNYTMIVADSVSKLKVSFVNDTIVLPDAGKSKVRFFQLAHDYTDTLNLFIDTFRITTKRIFNDQATNATYHSFQNINSGTYNIYLKKNNGSIAFTATNVALSSQKNYTIILKGSKLGATGSLQELSMMLIPYN